MARRKRRLGYGSPAEIHVDAAEAAVRAGKIYIGHTERKLAEKACGLALDGLNTVYSLAADAEAHIASAQQTVPGGRALAAEADRLANKFKHVCLKRPRKR